MHHLLLLQIDQLVQLSADSAFQLPQPFQHTAHSGVLTRPRALLSALVGQCLRLPVVCHLCIELDSDCTQMSREKSIGAACGMLHKLGCTGPQLALTEVWALINNYLMSCCSSKHKSAL